MSNLMYGEFDRENFALPDIFAAMLHVSLKFGKLAYLEGRGGGWICEGIRLKQLVGPLLVWMVPQTDSTITFLLNLIERFFSTGC